MPLPEVEASVSVGGPGGASTHGAGSVGPSPGEGSMAGQRMSTTSMLDVDNDGPPMVANGRKRMSFVGRLRDPRTGAMSQPRLFGGKVGASTAMTRSIGDREAARSCIPDPEVRNKPHKPSQPALLREPHARET